MKTDLKVGDLAWYVTYSSKKWFIPVSIMPVQVVVESIDRRKKYGLCVKEVEKMTPGRIMGEPAPKPITLTHQIEEDDPRVCRTKKEADKLALQFRQANLQHKINIQKRWIADSRRMLKQELRNMEAELKNINHQLRGK